MAAEIENARGLKEKSLENMEAAKALKGKALYNSSASRFYYAAFQSVKAYAYSQGKCSPDMYFTHESAQKMVQDRNYKLGEDYKFFCNYSAPPTMFFRDFFISGLDYHANV